MSTKKFKFGKTATIKEYGDNKKMSKIGIVVDGDDMSTASIFGDKQDWLNELHEKHGGEIEATVYANRDELFKADLGPTQYGACYDAKYSEWTIKTPRGAGGGATYRKNYGGGGWQGGGGFKSGGGWKPEYRGKPMPEDQFVDFCGRLILHAYKAAHKASPKASEDKLIEVAQSMFATMLIGMQKGMSFPTGYEPAPEAASGGDATTPAATGLDKSNPTIAAYISNIEEAKDQDECITIATEVSSDTALTDAQKQALKAECLRKQKAIASGIPF